MLRLPIPVALAALVVAGAATIYFYITVISNPTQGAWSDVGPDQTYKFTVPAGQWVILGTFGGSSIGVTSNVTMDIRADAVAALAWANRDLPEGTWRAGDFSVSVDSAGLISLNNDYTGVCTSGSKTILPNNMVFYYPNFTAPGARCSCQWPPGRFIIYDNGVLELWCLGGYPIYLWPVYGASADGVRTFTIQPRTFKIAIGRNITMYYIYTRSVYAIWVRPSANAFITVTVYP